MPEKDFRRKCLFLPPTPLPLFDLGGGSGDPGGGPPGGTPPKRAQKGSKKGQKRGSKKGGFLYTFQPAPKISPGTPLQSSAQNLTEGLIKKGILGPFLAPPGGGGGVPGGPPQGVSGSGGSRDPGGGPGPGGGPPGGSPPRGGGNSGTPRSPGGGVPRFRLPRISPNK